jgi:hypothetical protein
VLALCFSRQHQARRDRHPIYQDCTGAAITGATAFFGPKQKKHIPQHFQKGQVRLHHQLDRLVIDMKA